MLCFRTSSLFLVFCISFYLPTWLYKLQKNCLNPLFWWLCLFYFIIIDFKDICHINKGILKMNILDVWILLQTPLVFCYSFIVSMHVYLNWSYGLLFFPLFHFSLSLVIYFFLHGENLQIYLSIIFFCFYLLFYFFISFCCTAKYQWYIYPLFRVFSQINHYRILRRVHYVNSRSLLVILYIFYLFRVKATSIVLKLVVFM